MYNSFISTTLSSNYHISYTVHVSVNLRFVTADVENPEDAPLIIWWGY